MCTKWVNVQDERVENEFKFVMGCGCYDCFRKHFICLVRYVSIRLRQLLKNVCCGGECLGLLYFLCALEFSSTPDFEHIGVFKQTRQFQLNEIVSGGCE